MNVGDRDDALAVTRKVNGFMYKVCVGVGVTRSVCVSVSLFLSLSLCLSLSLSACISSVLSYPNAPSPSSLTTTHTLHTQPSFITYFKDHRGGGVGERRQSGRAAEDVLCHR